MFQAANKKALLEKVEEELKDFQVIDRYINITSICSILWYFDLSCLESILKSFLQKRIKKFFKTQSNIPVNDDNEIELNMSSVDNITYSVMSYLNLCLRKILL